MKPFKARLAKAIILFALGFVVLFVFRFIYGYTTGSTEVQEDYSSFFADNNESVAFKKNYASDNYKIKRLEAVASQVQVHDFNVDQKYEKTATVKSRTEHFDGDEKRVWSSIKKFSAIIQYEQNAGRTGNRSIHFLIGT